LDKNKRVYVLPGLHLSACLLTYVGLASAFVIPPLRLLALIFPVLLIVDLPFSVVAFALAWKYPLLAHLWILLIGTAWWYLISRIVVGWMSSRSAAQQTPQLFKQSQVLLKGARRA
jgi:hypothetical protein